jgi:hypothetical protein
VDKDAKFMDFELAYSLLQTLIPAGASSMQYRTYLTRQATTRARRYDPDGGHAAYLRAAREDRKVSFGTVKSELANVLEPTYAKLNNALGPWREDGKYVEADYLRRYQTGDVEAKNSVLRNILGASVK